MTVILVHHSSLMHLTIMHLWWYHVTNCMGYHSMGAWFRYVGLRVDSESVTNSEKTLFNSKDLPSNEAK